MSNKSEYDKYFDTPEMLNKYIETENFENFITIKK
jgi:hypothetical protein